MGRCRLDCLEDTCAPRWEMAAPRREMAALSV